MSLRSSPHLRRYQRTALVLLLLSGVINYVDRSTLAIGLPLIRKDLGISIAQSGYLLSAFLWAYAACQLPVGALIDRLGGRIMLSAGLGLWSLAQMLGGLVGSFWQFVGVRALLGFGESPQFPTSARITADWFPERQRGSATGLWNCSSTLGSAISAPFLTWLMLRFGWRGMFVSMGCLGLLIAASAFAVHRNPSEIALAPEDVEHLSSSKAEHHRATWADWKRLFAYRTTWGMVFGFFGTVYVTWLYFTWLPQYLEIQWHMSLVRTGWTAALPPLCGVFGSLGGGRLCDALRRGGRAAILSCKIPFLVSLFGTAICTLAAAYAPTSTVAVTAISVAMFLLYSASACAWSMATVAAGPHRAASLGSIQNSGGYLGGALAPAITGLLVDRTGSFRSALVVGALVCATGALLHLVLVGAPVGSGPADPAGPATADPSLPSVPGTARTAS